jgi:hypothetical protein
MEHLIPQRQARPPDLADREPDLEFVAKVRRRTIVAFCSR